MNDNRIKSLLNSIEMWSLKYKEILRHQVEKVQYALRPMLLGICETVTKSTNEKEVCKFCSKTLFCIWTCTQSAYKN